MKKPLLLSLMALALASCRAYIPGVVSSSSEESFSYVSSSSSSNFSSSSEDSGKSESSDSKPEESSESEESSSSESSSSESSKSSESSSSSGKSESSSSSSSSESGSSSSSSEWSPDYDGTNTFAVLASNFPDKAGNYSDGNYGDFIKNGQKFEYYRVKLNGSGEDAYINLFPSSPTSSLDAGSFYNLSGFGAIDFLEISYSSPDGPGVVSFGDNAVFDYSEALPKTISMKTAIINTRYSDFFKISAGDGGTLTLYSVAVHYYSDSSSYYPQQEMEAPDYRIEPVVFSGDLTAGMSQVSVPTGITQVGDTYVATGYKTYTYYTYEYIQENSAKANIAALTDPIDVANYFIAFGEAPVNFLTYNTSTKAVERKSGDYSLFGDKLRCISTYYGKSGYASKVPSRGYNPTYYELDVKVPGKSYSITNRQAGRVVVWANGFTCYGNYPAAVLTHDHYATFHEYLNWGRFGQGFSAERQQTPYTHTSGITLTKA